MSIELDGPLYLGSNSLQQQVDQNTEDITELQSDVSSIEGDIGSLDNLATSDKSSLVNAINETLSVLDPTQTADYIKNSKGLESGEISTNASILPWVEEMSHSTFDLSKFTVVGSPVITDDGIASGFSNINRIYVPTIEFLKENSWKICCPLPKGQTGATGLFAITGMCIQIAYTPENKAINYNLSSDGSTWDIASGQGFIASDLDITKEALYVIEFTGTQYKSYVLQNNQIVGSATDITNSNKLYYINTAIFLLGNNRNLNVPTNGSIDLKKFSITVDGVPVFSGNKTGLDTIRPDDYTIYPQAPSVSTVTVSDDGMASGFTTDNYVRKNNVLSYSDTDELIIKFKFKINTLQSQFIYAFGNFQAGGCYVGATGVLNGFLGSANNYINSGTNALSAGKDYIVKHILKDSKMWFEITDLSSGVTVETTPVAITATFALSDLPIYLGQGANTASFSPFDGTIDLNGFEIWKNGNLVYQPCLKIPYTESKTGSKIVNSIYRDRVNDMAEQFGFANYYTLSDTDFTLPQVELYGLIGQRTLRDSYRNGATYWELWSDRTLEIGGTCTSGVEYDLPRNFVSATDYVLSVPYSAKTASSFTPTVSGDFIAKGLGVL